MPTDGPGPARTAAVAFLLTGLLVVAGVAVAAVTDIDPFAAISGAALGALALVLLLRLVGGEDSTWEPLSVEQYAGQILEGRGVAGPEESDTGDGAAGRREPTEQLGDADAVDATDERPDGAEKPEDAEGG